MKTTLSRILSLARLLYRRLVCRQPAVLVVLDEPPRLNGFRAIVGWAMGRSAPITRVEAIVGGQVIAAGIPLDGRPDVLRHFPHFRHSGLVGFRLIPPAGLLPDGRYPLCIRATDSRGRRAEVHTTLEVNEGLADGDVIPSHLQGSDRAYQLWLRRRNPVSRSNRVSRLDCFSYQPTITIILPLFHSNRAELPEAIASVQAQSYDRWELCICRDTSHDSTLTAFLDSLVSNDPRIRYAAHPAESGMINRAFRMTRGDYLAFLDPSDRLAPNALEEVVRHLQTVRADVVYTDEDHVDDHGCRVRPFFKPDWSPDLLLSTMYIGRLAVYRRDLLERVGLPSQKPGPGAPGPGFYAHEWDLALRATAGDTSEPVVVHVPQVLYHRRLETRFLRETGFLQRTAAARLAVEEAVARRGLAASVMDASSPCTFHVRYRVPDPPLVSILIPTRDNHRLLNRCLRSIRERTSYPNYEILIIENGSRQRQTRRFLRACGEQVLSLGIPFNHSRLNNLAVTHAHGSLLLLLNDDTEVISPEWLTAMVEQAVRPAIGAVGACLLYPDGSLQHAGIILGLGHIAAPLDAGVVADGIDHGMHRLIRNVSAVTGACFMIRKELYVEMGGLDEDDLPTSFNDVDLCLKLRKAGYEIIYTPLARLFHYGSASRDFEQESRFARVMIDRWGETLECDPFWNPNLPHGADAYFSSPAPASRSSGAPERYRLRSRSIKT